MSKEFIKELSEVIDQSGLPKRYVKRRIVVWAVELKERVKIKTREGILYGEVGDFLIQGIQDEIYPCGRDIFFKTYEEVEG